MGLRAAHKVFLSYLALIFAVVAVLYVGTDLVQRRQLTDAAAQDLLRNLNLARAIHAQSGDVDPDSLADVLGELSGVRVTIIAADGVVLGDSDLSGRALETVENHGQRPEVLAAYAGRIGRATRRSTSVGTDLLYLASPTARGEVIRLALPLREVDAALARVKRVILAVGLGAIVFAALLSVGFSLAVTQPLRGIAATARAMAAGDLNRRLARRRQDDELAELGAAFNTLADELQKRLAQLEGERVEMQALIDAMTEAVLALAPDGTVRRANPAAREIFSLPDDPRGLPAATVSRRGPFLELVDRVLSGKAVPTTEVSHHRGHVLANAQPLPDGGAVLIFLDVTELRHLEAVRREFVANASHELKTPLTTILGYSETLLDDPLDPELRQRFIEAVHAAAVRLRNILDDLLDLSKIESGGWRVEPRVLSLREMATDVWSTFAENGSRGEIRFHIDVPPDADDVLVDATAIRQILSNLYSNAIRYTPMDGSIEVRASRADGTAEQPEPRVLVEVRDTGSGIPAAHLPRIFERFYRVDAARSRAEGGTGLGLAIVKHLVEAHGGQAEALSELGHGTTIRFSIPASEA